MAKAYSAADASSLRQLRVRLQAIEIVSAGETDVVTCFFGGNFLLDCRVLAVGLTACPPAVHDPLRFVDTGH